MVDTTSPSEAAFKVVRGDRQISDDASDQALCQGGNDRDPIVQNAEGSAKDDANQTAVTTVREDNTAPTAADGPPVRKTKKRVKAIRGTTATPKVSVSDDGFSFD